MYIADAIRAVKAVCDSEASEELMVKWLSDHDGAVVDNIVRQFEPEAEIPVYGSMTDREATELVIPAPYDGLYVDYLIMRCDLLNGDIEHYNNQAVLYEAKRREWQNAYNRQHRHTARGDEHGRGGINLSF